MVFLNMVEYKVQKRGQHIEVATWVRRKRLTAEVSFLGLTLKMKTLL